MPKIAAFIQARMSSSRLPGKVMKKALGRPLLFYLCERLKTCHMLDQIVITTSAAPDDDIIERECKEMGFECFRGSLDFVLDRFYRAAVEYKADIIVRITADCPLLMPDLVDRQVMTFLKDGPYDYLGYQIPYPEGLADVSIMPFETLKYSWEHAEKPSEKEHPPLYVINRPHEFKLRRLVIDSPINDLRFTVDEPMDLEVITKLLEELYQPGKTISLWDIEVYSFRHPEIVDLNKNITRNEGLLKSLKQDKNWEADKNK